MFRRTVLNRGAIIKPGTSLLVNQVGRVPFKSDLNTWHKTITNNTFAESINTLPAKILPRVANLNGVDDYINLSSNINVGKVFTLTTKVYLDSVTAKTNTITSTGNNDIIRIANNNSVHLRINAATTGFSLTTPLIADTWYDLVFIKNGTDVRVIIGGNDVSNSILEGNNIDFIISNLFRREGATDDYFGGLCPFITIDSTDQTSVNFQLTGQGGFDYDLVSGTIYGTWSGTGSRFDYDLEGSLYPNTQGYSLWQKAANPDIQVPFDINGNPLSLTAGVNIPAGYTHSYDVLAGSDKHNIYDSLVDMEYGSILQCDTSGVAYKDSTNAYGCIFDGIINYNNTATLPIIKFNSIDTQGGYNISEGYSLFPVSSGALLLRRSNIGSFNTLFSTVTSYILNNTDYRILIWRNETLNQFVTGAVGTFAVYIQGKTKTITTTEYTIPNTNEMELVNVSGGSGTNPVTDNTYTTSNYIVTDLDAGDQIRKININCEYVTPYDFTISTGAYSIIDNPDNAIFNRTNATRQTAASRASLFYNVNKPFTYHIKEISDPREYSKFFNDGWKGKIFGKIKTVLNGLTYDIIRFDEELNYATDKLGDDEYKVMKYCGIDVFAVLDGDGNPIVDENGYIVIN